MQIRARSASGRLAVATAILLAPTTPTHAQTLTDPGEGSLDISITNALDDEYYFYFASSRTMATNVTPGVPRLARATLRWRF